MDEKPIRVLLVEDNSADARLVEIALAESGPTSFQVEYCKCFSTLKDALRIGDFDVVLLDLSLPECDGLDTVRKVHEQDPRIPIVVLTGLKDEDISLRALREGAQDYLFKSTITGEVLRRAIRYAMERQRMVTELTTHQREKEEVRQELAHYRSLLGGTGSPITAQMAGVGPLRQRAPEVVERLEKEYGEILEAYVEATMFKQPRPHVKIESLASRLGEQAAGPRDVVDLHLRSVEAKSRGVHPRRANSYAIEGRLLALETMGYLMDYYRQRGFARLPSKEAKH